MIKIINVRYVMLIVKIVTKKLFNAFLVMMQCFYTKKLHNVFNNALILLNLVFIKINNIKIILH